MTRDEIENLIMDTIDAYETMREYQRRDDWVTWSEEKEQAAVDNFYSLRDRIVSLIDPSDE